MLRTESGRKLAGTRETTRSEPREELHMVHCLYNVPCDAPGSHDLNNSFPNLHSLSIHIQYYFNIGQVIQCHKQRHPQRNHDLASLSIISIHWSRDHRRQRADLRCDHRAHIFLEALLESKRPIHFANA